MRYTVYFTITLIFLRKIKKYKDFIFRRYLKHKPQDDSPVMNNILYIQDVPLTMHKTSRHKQSLEGKEQTGMKNTTELVLVLLLKHRKWKSIAPGLLRVT